MGLEKIIDFILSLFWDFWPLFKVQVYQKCVVLRNGKIYRVVGDGLWWKLPFIDEPNHYTVVTTTIATKAQTVRTKDGKNITIRSIIKYSINDVALHIESINDSDDAIIDFAQGHTMTKISSLDYSECSDISAISSELTKKLRNEVKKYGIYIEQQTITDFVETRNYRLYNDGDSSIAE